MSLDPKLVEQLAMMKATARRTRSYSRRWLLRGALMAVIAGVALYRGGQVNNAIGWTMLVLSGLSLSLARSQRRDAKAIAEKVALMEKT